MKKILLLILLSSAVLAQPKMSIIASFSDNQLPFEPRRENSGNYSIASFDIAGDVLYVNSYDSPHLYAYKNSNFDFVDNVSVPGTDFMITPTETGEEIESAIARPAAGRSILRRSFSPNAGHFREIDGSLQSDDGQHLVVKVPDRYTLKVSVHLRTVNSDLFLPFPGNLGYAECLGVDGQNNIYLLAETFVEEIPLSVNRFIYVLNSIGGVQSILKVPIGNQISLVKEFMIDADGNLFHLFADSERVYLFKWYGLNQRTVDTLFYPEEYYQLRHQNYFLPAVEPISEILQTPQIPASRTYALRLGEQYALYTYRTTASNLALTNTRASDGDTVRTPSWLIVGVNARIPYQWGGFSTLTQFSDGLKNGLYAGDIHTAGVSSQSVGVDCSGFVSRCWQLTYHASTSYMPNITTQYASWDSLKPGDAIHKVGHVRLFVERTPNGAFKVVESAGRNWDVSYWTFTLADLAAYTPRYYNNMQSDYANTRPVLQSVLASSDTSVSIRWTADTTRMLGYRLYASPDGQTWSLLRDESLLKAESTVVIMRDTMLYFRVSRILNNGLLSESNWSNVLGASLRTGASRLLIVDGFESETGSWRGAGHTFVIRYGKAVARLFAAFESSHSTEIVTDRVSLKDRTAVFWFTGDESIVGEALSVSEQNTIISYLEKGGSLFLCGSEIGYDLWEKGTAADKDFYTNYLKATYKADDASVLTAQGVASTIFAGHSFAFGQNYIEDYPDEIDAAGGSISCLKYGNGKGAGIQYTGLFGFSTIPGKLIYFGFPIETIADDSCFNAVVSSIFSFFSNACPVNVAASVPLQFGLEQNYPNPFNPSTTIHFHLAEESVVVVEIIDLLGREVETLLQKELPAGSFSLRWNGQKFASGMYICRLIASTKTETSSFSIDSRKMMLLR